MRYLRITHLVIGLTGVVLFLLSGQYMQHILGPLSNMETGPRMLYRSAHIYLLWASLLNLMLGCYFVPFSAGWRRALQAIGSLGMAVAPALICMAFYYEPKLHNLDRPYAFYAALLAFIGAGLHAITRIFSPTVK